MLRKLIVFAITSGLAKKAYDYYVNKQEEGPKASATRRKPVRKTAARAKPAATPRARG